MGFYVFIIIYALIISTAVAENEHCAALHMLQSRVKILETKLNQLLLKTKQDAHYSFKEKRKGNQEIGRLNTSPNMEENVQPYIFNNHTQKEDNDLNNGKRSSTVHLREFQGKKRHNQRRLLLSETPKGISILGHYPNAGDVAFYSYMSKNEKTPGPHHTIIFDEQRTNIGNGYNKYSGLFTAPFNGVYHFSWTIYVYCRSYISTEILKNGEVYGSAVAQSADSCNAHSSTSNVIIELKQGDVVFIRTNSRATSLGNITSTGTEKSTFSGFKMI